MGRIEILENYLKEIKERSVHITQNVKQEKNKIAWRKNCIMGIATIDEDNHVYSEWDGLFKQFTGREMAEAEFDQFDKWWETAPPKSSLVDWLLLNGIEFKMIEKNPLEEKIK